MSEFLFVEEYLDSTIKLSKTVPLKVPFVLDLKNKKAFTLAEVLITLGVIGVVAAMTIPTLVNNYQKTQYLTGLKKAYTQFNQALIQMAADNNCPGDLKCTGLFGAGQEKSLGDELVKYFKVAKNCEKTTTGCFSDKIVDHYDGTGVRGSMDDTAYRFITADGMALRVGTWGNNCGYNWSNNITNNMTQACALVRIDVNGLKGPNNLGIDIFAFHITNGNGPLLYPNGGVDDHNTGGWRDSSGNPLTCYPGNTYGDSCAARIIEEGWQMNYYGTHAPVIAPPPDPYAAGIMPDNSTLIAISNALHNYSALLKVTSKATLAQGYYNDLRERQIGIEA